MRRIKMVGAAGALVGSALVGGTLMSAAFAAPATTDTTTASGAVANMAASDAYVDTYLDTLASELGVSRSELGPAALAATNAAIDAAVEAGDMTADRASQLKDELGTMTDPEKLLVGHGALGGPGGPGHHGLGLGGSAADAAASAMGIDASDLVSQLRDGSSLQRIADARGVAYDTVASAVTDAVSSELATDVSDGRITQDQSGEILSNLQTWLDGGGQPGQGGFEIGHGHGRPPGEFGGFDL
jgi:hypothetical protein